MPNPLDGLRIKALNLYQGGEATNKYGFTIKSEEDKRDSRPISVQLGLDENKILSSDHI